VWPGPGVGLADVRRTGRRALVPVLFAYGGWQQTNFIAGELIEPERNLPRALVLGVVVVVLVYVLANVAYLRALGVGGLAQSDAPAADTMAVFAGPVGRTLITVGIVCSTFGFLNLVILVSPRVYQAMAADGLFFASFARLHPRYRTPVAAIVFQGVWASLLVFSGRYGALLDYVTFADWIFFGLTAVTLVTFRRREGAPGPGAFRLRAILDARGVPCCRSLRRRRLHLVQPRQCTQGHGAVGARRAGVPLLATIGQAGLSLTQGRGGVAPVAPHELKARRREGVANRRSNSSSVIASK
jgi:hypothetical protein